MFKLDVNVEDVNRYVSEKILESVLGEKIKDAVEKAIGDSIGGYRCPIKDIVGEVIIKYVRERLETEENKKILLEKIAEHVNDEKIQKFIESSFAQAVRLMKNSSY